MVFRFSIGKGTAGLLLLLLGTFSTVAINLGLSEPIHSEPTTIVSESPAPSRRDRAKQKLPEQATVILHKAQQLELYTLNGKTVLNKVVIKDGKVRTQLLDALEQGIEKAESGSRCFLPGYEIRATYENKTVDLVICFRCSWIYVYFDDNKTKSTQVVIDGEVAEPAFNEVLNAAGVPIPPSSW